MKECIHLLSLYIKIDRVLKIIKYYPLLRIFLLSYGLFGFLNVYSQTALAERKKWEGQYDVRMIGSMVMQPAFVSSVNPIRVTGLLTDDIMRRTGRSFTTNNNFAAFPDSTHSLPLNVKNGNAITDPASTYFGFSCPSVLNTVCSYHADKSKVAMVYADCDDDSTTFQSSWALLDFGSNKECVNIQAAYLYWVGTYGKSIQKYDKYNGYPTMKSFIGGDVGGVNSDFNKVKLKLDNSDYVDVVADTIIKRVYNLSSDPQYVCVSNITSLVKYKNTSRFQLANIQSNPKTSSISGWSLVVIYSYYNCPFRQIVLFDGLDWIYTANSYKDYKLTNLQAPSTSNFRSYLGLGVLDGENTAPEIMSLNSGTYSQYTIPVNRLDGTLSNIVSNCNFETLDFCSGGDTVKINPFATDQPSYKIADANGVPYTIPQPTMQEACSISSFSSLNWLKAIDGVSSSKITTYDELTNTNGNKVQRMPSLSNTLGLDLHHFRLPQGAIKQGSSSANMRVKSGAQGGTAVFLSYIAIETLQPLLQLKVKSVKNTVDLSSKEIKYNIKIFNNGGKPTNSNEVYVIDSLDAAVDDIANFESTSASKGLSSKVDGGVLVNPTTGKKYIKILVLDTIPAIDIATNKVLPNDTLEASFTVHIKDKNYNAWKSKCRRVISNSAWVYYKDINNKEVSFAANSDLCNNNDTISEVQVVDSIFESYDKRYETKLNLYQANVASSGINILNALKPVILDSLVANGLPQSDLNQMTFFYANNNPVLPTDVFDFATSVQSFTAVLSLSGSTCSETYKINCFLGKTFNTQRSKLNPSCHGLSDGKITLNVSGGIEPDSVAIELFENYYSPQNPVASINKPIKEFVYRYQPGIDLKSYVFDSLLSGKYTMRISSKLGWFDTKYDTLSIVSPTLYKIKLQGDTVVCAGQNANVLAQHSSSSGINKYLWESSLDGVTWFTLSDSTQTITTKSQSEWQYFRASAIATGCLINSDTLLLHVLPQNVLTISPAEAYGISSKNNIPIVFNASSLLSVDSLSFNWYYSSNEGQSWSDVATSNLGQYSGYNTNSLQIAKYLLSMNNYLYEVEAKDRFGCKSSANARLYVSDLPRVNIQTFAQSCSYLQDGTAVVEVSLGEINTKYSVKVYKGLFSDVNVPSVVSLLDSVQYKGSLSVVVKLDTLKNLNAGFYTVVVRKYGDSKNTYYPFEITSPKPIEISASSENTNLCINDKAMIYADLKNAPDNASVKYNWYTSIDNANWEKIASVATNATSYIVDVTRYFKVIATSNTCSATSNIVKINVLPTPVVHVLPVDTGCFLFDLHNLQVEESSGLENLKLTLHRTKPKSLTDNKSLIKEGNYTLAITSMIYARMSIQDVCYGLDSGLIYIKPMQECYPITVPELFSPDGDGINDRFEIQGLDEYANPKITVYDVQGNIVFEGDKDSFRDGNAWDGKYMNRDLPDADYWYLIKSKEIKPIIGHFSIKRNSRYNSK